MLDPVMGGLMQGGMSLLGNIFGNMNTNSMMEQMQGQKQQFDVAQQKDAQGFNQSMMQQQQAFQSEMSGTAYQRARADMEKAGLNPMMMFSSGGPASSPAGGMASSPAPSTSTPISKTSALSGVGSAISNALSSAVHTATTNKLIEETANANTENALIRARTLSEKQKEKLLFHETTRTSADTDRVIADLGRVARGGQQGRNEMELGGTAAGKLLDQAGMAGRKVSDIISPVTNVISGARGVQRLFSDRWRDF